MNNCKEHQELLQKTALLVQQNFKDCFFIPRTIGLFETMKGHKISIGKTGQADAEILLPAMILGIKFQIHIEVEFKTGNAKQSKAQLGWQKEIDERNGLYILARGPEEVIKIIRDRYGIFLSKQK